MPSLPPSRLSGTAADVPPWLVWLLTWLLPKTIAGYRTDVLLREHKKIEAVIEVFKEAGMDEDEAKKEAVARVAERPDADAEDIARKAIEDRGLTWTP